MSVATLEQQLAPLLAPRAKVSLKRGTLVWTLIVPRRFSSNRAEAGSLYLARSVLPSSSSPFIFITILLLRYEDVNLYFTLWDHRAAALKPVELKANGLALFG